MLGLEIMHLVLLEFSTIITGNTYVLGQLFHLLITSSNATSVGSGLLMGHI